MNKYETVMIINDTLTQEQKDKVVNKILNYIENKRYCIKP